MARERNPSQYNKVIIQIKEQYGKVVTQLGKYADISSGLIIPTGSSTRSGQFRTRSEVNIERQKFGLPDMSVSEYNKAFSEILKQVDYRLSLRKEEQYQHNYLYSVVGKALDAESIDIDFSTFTDEEIRSAMERANARVSASRGNSNDWYKYLIEELENT